MNRWLLAVVFVVSGCVSKPCIPDGIRKETRQVRIGKESVAVDFYHRLDEKPRPMAVIVHGFLANKARMAHWGLLLAREGFIAAVPDNPTRANDARNAAAIAGLVQAGHSGKWPVQARSDGRVVLVGFSRGGFETLIAAAGAGRAADAWIGLDPVDRNGAGQSAASRVRIPGLALLADPSPLNAHGNARGMLSRYAGPLEIARVPGAGHLDAESPRRGGEFAAIGEHVTAFLDKTVPRR